MIKFLHGRFPVTEEKKLPEPKSLGWKVIDLAALRHPPELLASAVYCIAGLLLFLGVIFFGILLTRVFYAATNGSPDDVNKLLLALAGMVGAPFVVWRVVIAARANQVAKENAAEQSRIANENLYATLLTKAVEQLGATREEKFVDEYITVTGSTKKDVVSKTVPNIEIRLGGIYALEKIAKDHKSLHMPVMEILCSYVRQNAENSDFDNQNESDEKSEKSEIIKKLIRIDVQAAVSVIGRRNMSIIDEEIIGDGRKDISFEDDVRFDLSNCRFTGLNMKGLTFSRANFERSVFVDSNFDDAYFDRTNFSKSEFKNVTMQNIKVNGCKLDESRFIDIYIGEAIFNRTWISRVFFENVRILDSKMLNCHFYDSQMKTADFYRCDLSGSFLSRTDFSGSRFAFVVFDGSDFWYTNLDMVIFQECDLTMVQNLMWVEIDKCYVDELTKFPANFVRPHTHNWLEKSDNENIRKRWIEMYLADWGVQFSGQRPFAEDIYF